MCSGCRRTGHASWRRRGWAIGTLLLISLGGCAWFGSAPKLEEPVGRIAVLPVERDERTSNLPLAQPGPQLAPDAEEVLTAQIYDVLSSSPKWRFVPDMIVSQALEKVSKSAPLKDRAVELGTLVDADAVLCGTVSRFVERVGTQYGARHPAAVSFELFLVSTATGKVLWQGSFDQQQEALSTNLFNWWQFWEGGPRWFTAAEFAHLGVERLLNQLAQQID